MKWSEREYFILRLLSHRTAAIGTAIYVDPEIIRALLAESEGKTTADVDKLLKGGAK